LDEHPWLAGPVGSPSGIGDEWLTREAERIGGHVEPGGGLLASFASLASTKFDPARVNTQIADFYEHTDRWRLDVEARWSPGAWPFGWMLSTVFARRLQQLALPLLAADTARGMESRVEVVVDDGGAQLGAAWIRTLRASSHTAYSGWYGVSQLPRATGPSVRVVFPLPNGHLTIFLAPMNDLSDGLVLTSPIAEFGDNGAYLVVVEDEGYARVRRAPIAEEFHLYFDRERQLRTDHAVRLWTLPVLTIRYELEHT
jgi:hypothetical protein